MARTFHRKRGISAVSEINVTPLIDLAFALLIIFMITTPLLEQTIPLQLPEQTHQQNKARPDVEFQVISINQEGEVFWGEDTVDILKLNDLLAALATGANPPVISLRADGRLPYQKVIDVIDLIEKNNLTKLSLDTQVK